MRDIKVWDPFVRVFHWSVVAGVALNALVLDDDGAAHQWVGWIVAALVAARLVWGMVGSRYARFSGFWHTVASVSGQIEDMATGRRRIHIGHTPLGALMIFNLIGCLIGISASGYMMTTNAFWGVDWVEELHESLVAWLEISVVLHVGAVIWESRRTGVNLPRAMITGVKSLPEDASLRP